MSNALSSRIMLLLSCAALAACSDDSPDPVDGVQQVMTAACNRLDACGEFAFCTPLDVTQRAAITRSIEAGRIVYEPQLLEPCLAYIRQKSCSTELDRSELFDLANHPAGLGRANGDCTFIYRGLVPRGGACTAVGGADIGDCDWIDYCSDDLRCVAR